MYDFVRIVIVGNDFMNNTNSIGPKCVPCGTPKKVYNRLRFVNFKNENRIELYLVP